MTYNQIDRLRAILRPLSQEALVLLAVELVRALGRCEVQIRHSDGMGALSCHRRAQPQSHHLIFGIGKKNFGPSILAEHRLAVCELHHDQITQHVLVPVPGCDRERADSVKYERRL